MKKSQQKNDDSENEFDVDEPDELQESEDDWTPSEKKGRRQSSRQKSTPAKKPRLAKKAKPVSSEEESKIKEEPVDEPDEDEVEEDEEEDDDESLSESDEEFVDTTDKKKRGRGRGTAVRSARGARAPRTPGRGRGRGTATATATATATSTVTNPESSEESDENYVPVPDKDGKISFESTLKIKVGPEWKSGAYIVLKEDLEKLTDPPIWMIDGLALLQQYMPFVKDGKTLYRSTTSYAAWCVILRDKYNPIKVNVIEESEHEKIVEYLRDTVVKVEKDEKDGEVQAGDAVARTTEIVNAAGTEEIDIVENTKVENEA